MKYNLSWRVLFKVQNKENALRKLKEIEENLQQPLTIQACQKYWKFPETFECVFTTPVVAETNADIVYETLLMMQKLGYNWMINGPHLLENDQIEFDSILDSRWGKILIAGLEWAHVDLYSDNEEQIEF
jgi:hypothetical protein